MTTHDQPEPPEPPQPQASGFDQIVDDEEELNEALEWACKQWVAGIVTAEEMTAQLIDGGWGQDTAEEIVETARKHTLVERGGTTRAMVAAKERRRYWSANRFSWFTIFVPIASLRRLLFSLGSIWRR